MSIWTTWFGGVGSAGVGPWLPPFWPCGMGPMKFPFGWTCFFEGLINVRKLWNSQGYEFEMYPYYVPNPKKKKRIKITVQTSICWWVPVPCKFWSVCTLAPQSFHLFLSRFFFPAEALRFFYGFSIGRVRGEQVLHAKTIGDWGLRCFWWLALTDHSECLAALPYLWCIFACLLALGQKKWPVQNSFAQANFT